jgi:hypothetical protein
MAGSETRVTDATVSAALGAASLTGARGTETKAPRC